MQWSDCGVDPWVMLGAKALPSQWIEPINDALETAVFGYNYPKFRGSREQTLDVVLKEESER